MEIDDVLFRRPGVAPPHLSTAAPVLCSQQPNRTDTPSPRVTPLWGVCVCVCVCVLWFCLRTAVVCWVSLCVRGRSEAG